jgi:ribosomal protein S12 methylthiotransferase
MMHKTNVITLGCSKNTVDSEVLMKQLQASGIEVVHDSNEPTNTVIINTCGFIADAKEESIDTILNSVALKNAGKIKKIIVFGCLSERYSEMLKKKIPEVDVWYGVHDMKQIVTAAQATFNHELLTDRILTTPSHYAYLKIAEGCNRRCSFCAIPVIRGKHISKPIEIILDESKRLVKNGVKELILISQDLTCYGIDLYGKQCLTKLVGLLSEQSGAEWIRLHYTFPAGFPLSLLDLMRKRTNVCNYIDIPLQHINDKILKDMQRGIGKEATIDLLEQFRERLPNATIRTTFIVGYPGETEKAFLELANFVKSSQFDRMGVFTYSPEEQTASFKKKDRIPQKVKTERAEYLMLLQQEISLEKNQTKIGTTQKVLIDDFETPYYVGRTEYDSPEVDNTVLIESKQPLSVGDFYNVKIVGAEMFDLMGVV